MFVKMAAKLRKNNFLYRVIYKGAHFEYLIEKTEENQ